MIALVHSERQSLTKQRSVVVFVRAGEIPLDWMMAKPFKACYTSVQRGAFCRQLFPQITFQKNQFLQPLTTVISPNLLQCVPIKVSRYTSTHTFFSPKIGDFCSRNPAVRYSTVLET